MNEKEFEFLGIKRWHDLGYKGKNIVIANKEVVNSGVFDDVECSNPSPENHGTTVMDYIRQVVPDARKIALDRASTTKNGVWNCPEFDQLLKNPPTVFTSSTYSRSDSEEEKLCKYEELLNKGCILIHAAGNSGEKGLVDAAKHRVWLAIGSCRYNNGNPKVSTNSSKGEELDFMSLDNLRATWDNKKHTGTSFSAPLFAGMVGLVQDFFIINTGQKLTNEKMLEFIKDNCIDLGDKGHDNYYGHGLFILPNPATIKIEDYCEVVKVEEKEEKMFKDYTEWEKAIEFLAAQGEMDSPKYWLERISSENDINLMWFCIKWANAVARSKKKN